MFRSVKPLLVAALLALGGMALTACAIQLPDGTNTEYWLKERNAGGE